MQITIRQLLEFAITHEFSLIAHVTYWALQQGTIQLDDDARALDELDVDLAAVRKLMQQNKLALGKVKLFVISCDNSWYAFYFSETALEAATLHQQMFRERCHHVTEAPRLLHTRFHFAHTAEDLTLLEYRTRPHTLPLYIGHAKGGEKVLWRFG